MLESISRRRTTTTAKPMRFLLLCLALSWSHAIPAQTATNSSPAPARLLLLGLFHFDNPGLDAVKYKPIDVLQAEPQAYLIGLAERLARFAPTKVVLEFPQAREEAINRRYAEYLAGNPDLPRNEIYQLGFRIARLANLKHVHGFDTQAPPQEVKLWGYLSQEPDANAKLMELIGAESRRLQALHETKTLREILLSSNTEEADRRNKGFYMLLNPVGAGNGLFHGADASANWWHRNLRMYALLQRHAARGERVLVIAGSGHTAILRDFLRADAERVEENVLSYF
ncbi:MAG: DUF5694 domain-containing protein [Burkholderiales bacterium]